MFSKNKKPKQTNKQEEAQINKELSAALGLKEVKNFCTDLDAICEEEAALTYDERMKYNDIVGRTSLVWLWFAPAKRRAKALLQLKTGTTT